MNKALVVFGTTTGNTEILAEAIAAGLKAGKLDVTVKNVADCGVDELDRYETIVWGCSTWGWGELQNDFGRFYDDLAGLASLTGKRAAVFGPGDRECYPDTFCRAVTLLEDALKGLGAEIIVESLTVDGPVEPAVDRAREWGIKIAERIRGKEQGEIGE